jgi:nicotinamide mononucleotide transporter
LCWPWGIVSCIALGFFFAEIGLPGQQWLNWGYFMAVQLWSWPYWAFGGEHNDELPVTVLTWTERISYIVIIGAFTGIAFALIGFFSPESFHPILDSLVVAASVVAQFLLGRKKVESWILWLGPVNMLSIFLFFSAGAYTLTALYVAFFIHAAFAINSWRIARVVAATT